MRVEKLVEIIGADFFVGVPDSQLKALCDYLMNQYGIDEKHHIIAANEGNCVGIAAGYHLATEKVPVVYMQNSGEGNVINPLASLLNDKVYAIPVIFVIGWRGEPGVHDEPQHIYQGQITIELLQDMGIDTFVIGSDTTENELSDAMKVFREQLAEGRCVAFVVRKGSLVYEGKANYINNYKMNRETVIEHIISVTGDDPVVSTTGKASRELFEIREANGQVHDYDFLTVGSMGHSSAIAFGLALNKPEKKVWCIDGDGAVLMHMGNLAVIGSYKPKNLVHVVINNGAHETVGGMPTVAVNIDFCKVADGCGYPYVKKVQTYEQLDIELNKVKVESGPCFVEVLCTIGSRKNLGRPTTTAIENKKCFMDFLRME